MQFRFPSAQFRAIPSPSGSKKDGFFFVEATSVPGELMDWRDVNPREISRNTAVYRDIVGSLDEVPEQFHERNRGITIAALGMSYDSRRKEVILELTNPSIHGVIDGAHTLDAILSFEKEVLSRKAYVLIHAVTGVNEDQIVEIAGGLNTSQQVDLKSLENLKGSFDALKAEIADTPYAGLVAYKMNEKKPIDVRVILQYLAVFDCTQYHGHQHPTPLYGRKNNAVRFFADQAASPQPGDSLPVLITLAKDILLLRDRIEAEFLSPGRKRGFYMNLRRKYEQFFSGERVRGKISEAWILPSLAAFRANLVWNGGAPVWEVSNEKLIETAIPEIYETLKLAHADCDGVPDRVARLSSTYNACYSAVEKAVLKLSR